MHAVFESRGHGVAEFAAAGPFLAAVDDLNIGCLLLDVRLPDMDGLLVQKALQDRGKQVAVILMTGFGEVPLAVAAMKAGAVDFIEKPFQIEQIVRTVDEAIAGRQTEGASDGGTDVPEGLDVLTRREREVLDLLVEGLQNKMVARRLNISPRTAEVHRANIMRKMQATSFSHLIRLALAADTK